MYNLADVSNQTQATLARPGVVPLQTTNTCARWQHEVTIGLPSQGNDSGHSTTSAAAQTGAQQQNPVTFLLKLSSQDGGFVRYIWQVISHFIYIVLLLTDCTTDPDLYGGYIKSKSKNDPV